MKELPITLRIAAFERTGNIDSALVFRELEYQTGDLYSRSVMDKTSKQIREIGIFSTANLIRTTVADSDSLVDIFVDLKGLSREWRFCWWSGSNQLCRWC